MPSSKAQISNSPPRHARSSTTTRSACSRTVIAGSARSPRTSRSMRRTGDGDGIGSSPSAPWWSGFCGSLRMIVALFFYLFAGICVASAVMVIASRNPVHSVLYIILAFVNCPGLFVIMAAEFLAMILIVVYVGAVAVLFLFVVMMLDVDFSELKQGALQYLPVGML